MKQGYWLFESDKGVFTIVPHSGRFHAVYEGDSLGAYNSAIAALDDLLGGHTFSPSNGVQTDECGLPDDLSDWEFVSSGGR